MDIPIPKEKIVSHVKAFWRNESFFINLSYKGDPNMRSVDVVTPMVGKLISLNTSNKQFKHMELNNMNIIFTDDPRLFHGDQ